MKHTMHFEGLAASSVSMDTSDKQSEGQKDPPLVLPQSSPTTDPSTSNAAVRPTPRTEIDKVPVT